MSLFPNTWRGMFSFPFSRKVTRLNFEEGEEENSSSASRLANLDGGGGGGGGPLPRIFPQRKKYCYWPSSSSSSFSWWCFSFPRSPLIFRDFKRARRKHNKLLLVRRRRSCVSGQKILLYWKFLFPPFPLFFAASKKRERKKDNVHLFLFFFFPLLPVISCNRYGKGATWEISSPYQKEEEERWNIRWWRRGKRRKKMKKKKERWRLQRAISSSGEFHSPVEAVCIRNGKPI